MSREILVLDCYEHTLTVVRSLTEAGHNVVLGVTQNDLDRGYVHSSRFISSTWLHSDLVDEPDSFDAELLAYLEANQQINTIFPVGENSVRKLAAIRSSIPANILIVMPSNHAIETCMNKPDAYRLANECGIPVPGTRTVITKEEFLAAIDELGLPAIAKPLDSTNLLLNKKCVFVRTESDLDTIAGNWPDTNFKYVVQNEIRGVRHNCDVIAENGEIKVYFEAEILRTDQLDYAGNSVFDRSISPDPEHRKYCERFVAALDYTGLTLIQFLKDPETGETCFLEANPRAGAAISLAVNCGVDLPAAAVRACAGEPAGVDSDYPINRKRDCFHDDLQGIRKAMLYNEIGVGKSLSWFGRACLDAIRANYYSTFVWNDPVPTLKIYWNLFTRLIFKDKRGTTANAQSSAEKT